MDRAQLNTIAHLQHARRVFLLLLCWLPLTAMAVTLPATDPALEQELDNYKQLLTDDKKVEAAQKLYNLIADLPPDTPISTKVRAHGYHILEYVLFEQSERALQQAEQLLQLAEDSKQVDAISEALITRIYVQMYQPDEQVFIPPGPDSALMADVLRLSQMLELASNYRIVYFGYDTLGNIYSEQSEYELALQYYIAAYDAVANTNDYKTVARLVALSEQISRLHVQLHNYPAAYKLITDAVQQATEHQLTQGIASLYVLKGYTEAKLGMPEQELLSYQQGLALAERTEDYHTTLQLRNNLASIATKQQDYANATQQLQHALKLAREQQYPYYIHLLQMTEGHLLVAQGQYPTGIAAIERSLAYFRQSADKARLQRLLGELADAYQQAGYHQKQATALLEQRSLREEVFQAERDHRISELKQRFEATEQVQKSRLLEQENVNQARLLENKRLQHNFTLLFALTMTLAAILLYLLQNKLRRRGYRLHQDNQQLQQQSLHDPLTGLCNRRALMQQMTAAPARTDPAKPQSAVFLLMDIDHFKVLNDTYGHAAGDAVLVEVGKRLSQICRGADLLVRWGGEEFLLYLPQTNIAAIPGLAGRLLHAIAATPICVGELQLQVSLTGGAVCSYYPGRNSGSHVPDWEQLVQLADAALYFGKQQGRNRICSVEQLQLPLSDALARLASNVETAGTASWLSLHTTLGPNSNSQTDTLNP